jgi:hypothetical protein
VDRQQPLTVVVCQELMSVALGVVRLMWGVPCASCSCRLHAGSSTVSMTARTRKLEEESQLQQLAELDVDNVEVEPYIGNGPNLVVCGVVQRITGMGNIDSIRSALDSWRRRCSGLDERHCYGGHVVIVSGNTKMEASNERCVKPEHSRDVMCVWTHGCGLTMPF